MAMGTNNNQNERNQQPNYYSRLRIRNDKDKLQLSNTFWNGLLKLSISTIVDFGSNNQSEELANIFLTPVKAQILADYVEQLKQEKSGMYGINSGVQGIIVIGKEDAKRYFVVIAKVNENGQYESTQRFNLNVDYNYGLKINNIDNLSFDKLYDDEVEINQLQNMLADFSRSSNGAIAYSVVDLNRYEREKINNIIKKTAEKCGVETGYKKSQNQQTSFFNNDNSQSSKKDSHKDSSSYSSTVDESDFLN